MIRLCGREDNREVLRRTSGQPMVGVLCRMHWEMLGENPRLPHRFYFVGDEALLKLSGGRATLCGTVQDADELGAFLRFAAVSQMTALDFFPPGWHLIETNSLLLRPAGLPHDTTAVPLPGKIDTFPPAEEVLSVLESADGPITPQVARDFLYADLNARRNHGKACVYGIRKAGRLAATAGLWALSGAEGYVACVETRPDSRRQGYATALLQQLCKDFKNRTLCLICRGELVEYYGRFGFGKTGRLGLISVTQ
ncbi:GNAT family N-acetyltransferase [Ruminococcaceae bacterium OttesenSCG-928-I18]|nr:GNAT family N-acetyltransferase [Ruminococcaceae bacterium OttesenSCG-928-I18]